MSRIILRTLTCTARWMVALFIKTESNIFKKRHGAIKVQVCGGQNQDLEFISAECEVLF